MACPAFGSTAGGGGVTVFDALILGVVEGLTEFLPISSTGHLILASRWLGLGGDAVKTFDIVIQTGALGAVIGLYRERIAILIQGILKGNRQGLLLLRSLGVSFLPVAAAGMLLRHPIKAYLFEVRPVAIALAAGGVFMIGLDMWLLKQGRRPRQGLESITFRQALMIGLAQCLSLWPGTSRAMVTIAAGMIAGLPVAAAAEYSFLLAIPTLGAATLFDGLLGGPVLLREAGFLTVAVGFIASAAAACCAVTAFVRYLSRYGLAPFGWYRIGLAIAVAAWA